MNVNTIITMKLTVPSLEGSLKEIEEDIPVFKVREIRVAIANITEKEMRDIAKNSKRYYPLEIAMEISDSGVLLESLVFKIPSSARSKIIFTICEIIDEKSGEIIFNMESYTYEVVGRGKRSYSPRSLMIMKLLGEMGD